jgi:hypothetical protein
MTSILPQKKAACYGTLAGGGVCFRLSRRLWIISIIAGETEMKMIASKTKLKLFWTNGKLPKSSHRRETETQAIPPTTL